MRYYVLMVNGRTVYSNKHFNSFREAANMVAAHDIKWTQRSRVEWFCGEWTIHLVDE